MQKIIFVAKNKETIKEVLKKNFISKRAITKLIKAGIKVNSKIYYKNTILRENDEIEIEIEDENIDYEPIKSDLEVLYEDRNLLIINKNSGITVNSKNMENLSNYLAYYFLENGIKSKIRLINRLDMNTSGIMLVAKNKYAQAYYQKEIEENNLIKKYIAFVEGNLKIDKKFEIKLSYDKENKNYIESENGLKAVTIFKSLENNEKYSKIEAQILTGKTHQIRSSLSSLGHPIIGDYLYGSKIKLDRFLLHSYKLVFNEFLTGEKISVTSNYDFDKYLKNLKGPLDIA